MTPSLSSLSLASPFPFKHAQVSLDLKSLSQCPMSSCGYLIPRFPNNSLERAVYIQISLSKCIYSSTHNATESALANFTVCDYLQLILWSFCQHVALLTTLVFMKPS